MMIYTSDGKPMTCMRQQAVSITESSKTFVITDYTIYVCINTL